MTPQEFVQYNSPKTRDQLFEHQDHVKDFQFDENVTRVFPDMIGRSVPAYWDIVEGIGLLSKDFVRPELSVYDLGTSLGAVAWSVYSHTQHPILALDSSKTMIDQLEKNLQSQHIAIPITPILTDITKYPFQNTSLCILNFTLQFIPRKNRYELLSNIFKALSDGGALILSEKLHFSNNEHEKRIRRWHHEWKYQQGYSRQEIQQKAKSISNVMRTDSLETHINRLKDIGFRQITIWYQAYSFVSLVAEK